MPETPKIDLRQELLKLRGQIDDTLKAFDAQNAPKPPDKPVIDEHDHLKRFSPISSEHFEYLGSARLPKRACGAETNYCNGVLTGRWINSTTFRLYSDSHVYSGGAIYQFDLPAFSRDHHKLPFCKITKEHGDVYFGRKVNDSGDFVPTLGSFRWDETISMFVWTYGTNYATEHKFGPSIGMSGANLQTAMGPYSIHLGTNGPANTHWTRGGTVRLPGWFADAYVGGVSLCAGFGGYYSIIDGGSAGPALVSVPLNGDKLSKTGKIILGHPWTKAGLDFSNHAVRLRDYNLDETSWVGQQTSTARPGRWTAADEIGGENHAAGAVYIDTADKSGLLIWASQGTGKISYEEGGVKVQKRKNVLYSYSPWSLAAAATGLVEPHEAAPLHATWNLPNGEGRVAGVHFDSRTKTLYMIATEAFAEEGSLWPLLHAYKLKD